MIKKNYMKGVWSRKFILDHPKIVTRHTEGYVWDIDALLADCDARIAAHGGDGKKAWAALNEEFSKKIHDWAVEHQCDEPAHEASHTPEQEQAILAEQELERQAEKAVKEAEKLARRVFPPAAIGV